MRYRDGRRSICLSSQSGCPLTCTFCATGQMKFGRNLTASEILDQALHLRRIEQLDHCVFMGMGEPMMNIDNVLARLRAAARAWHHPSPHGDLHRRLDPGHRDGSTECDMPIRLALSLHAPDDALRTRSCRSTTATRWPTCSTPAGASTSSSGAWSSSST